jgi:hypothetical protein
VEQLEDAERAVGGHQVQIGHPASEQRMSLAEVVVDVQPGDEPREPPARLVHARQLRHDIDQSLHPVVPSLKRRLRHRVLERSGSNRVTLVVVRVQEALRAGAVDHLGELPAQVHRILDTEAEALSSRRVMHVRRVAGEEDASCAVGRRLTGHVREPRDPRGIVDPEVGAVDRDQRLAQIAQSRLAARPDPLLGDDAPHLAVLHRLEGVDAGGVVAKSPRRLHRGLHLGDQVAPGRVPSGELDAGCLADDAASSVAPDEILRPQRCTGGQLDVDARVVLREARHLTSVGDPHRQLGDPVGQDALSSVLADPERIRMPRREVAHVQQDRAERRGLGRPTLREEATGDPTLIQHLDGARVETTGP